MIEFFYFCCCLGALAILWAILYKWLRRPPRPLTPVDVLNQELQRVWKEIGNYAPKPPVYLQERVKHLHEELAKHLNPPEKP
jgi:hypothetical protein